MGIHSLDYSKQPEWTQEEAIAYECACEVIGDMIGIYTGRIYAEKRKISPDWEKIERFDDERARLFREREQLNGLDHETIARIRKEYGAKVQAHREGAKEALARTAA
ncbi:MAG TPA: hypothetical protein DEB25_09045 [Desulfobulbaceae bacterium]|nr:hypothetical protein [Desulfobulbaceae bacterium]